MVPRELEQKLEEVLLNFPDGFDVGSMPKFFYAVHQEYLKVRGARFPRSLKSVTFRIPLAKYMHKLGVYRSAQPTGF